jgi:glycosyltransferase involved in cell wall biosynthesis
VSALSICIIGLDDYGLLTGERTTQYVGGETVQHVLLARAWQQLGADVSIIVSDHGQPRVQLVDGITAIASHAKGAGLPGIRFIHPHSTSLVSAMRLADADVYYQSLAGYNTGLTAWFCRRHAKRFVFRISSDAYCTPGKQLMRLYRDRKVYEYGVRRADLIIAQTEHQRRLLRAGFELESELANLAAEAPATEPHTKDIDVLWVANFRAVKQPDLVVELARRLPHLKFVVVGGGQEQYARRMRQAERELPNLAMTGPVAYDAVGAYFDRARVFLNTSSLEGFPNTFVQAWMRAIPVVSFFDPDGLIAREGMGCAVTDLDAMTDALRGLADDAARRRGIGERAQRFAAASYSANAVARRYLDLFGAHFGTHFGTPGRSLAGVRRIEGGRSARESAEHAG